MNKIKKLIESTGLNYKNQIIVFAIINLITIAVIAVIFFFLKNPIIIGVGFLIIVLIDYLFLSRYQTIKSMQNKEILMEFASLLPFFKTYIENGYTVYQSLKEICAYTSNELLYRIQKLISDIDEDKTIAPFINFSKTFNYLQIEQLMICVYQMIDEGYNTNHIYQFQILFDKIRDEMIKRTLENKINSLSNMSIFPLIGSAILIITITFGVIAIIGASLNGI